MSEKECIFCSIISGLIPAKMVGSTDNSVAFMDTFPLAAGHVLVVPRKHYEKIQDLSASICSDLFGLVQDMVSKVDKITGSTLVAAHNGKGSGQEIPHVHIHLVPRDKNDGAGPIHSMFGKNTIQESDMEKAYDTILQS